MIVPFGITRVGTIKGFFFTEQKMNFIKEMCEPVEVTRIIIKAAVGVTPFELLVHHTSRNRDFILRTINGYIDDTGGDKNIPEVFRHWKHVEMTVGHHLVEVAGTCIGSVTITHEKMPFVYGVKIISPETKYTVTLTLNASSYTWREIIRVQARENPCTIMRKAIDDSSMLFIPNQDAKWLSMIGKLIPDDRRCGSILYAGTVIGEFSIKETK